MNANRLQLVAILLIVLILPLSGQNSQPTGRVLDAAGAPIEGAVVVATPSGASATSDKAGEFSLALDPGSYTVKITKDGFADSLQTIQFSQVHDEQPGDFTLQIAPVRYAVTVTEGPRYVATASSAATKTLTPLIDVPQSITGVTQQLIHDQMMLSVGDVVRYVPGVTAIQGENNRDQVVIRGNSTSADFFVDGVRDDVQYYRDLYNLDRVEVLKGPNAMIFGRGGGGGVVNRVTKEAEFMPLREITLTGGMYDDKRFATDLNQQLNDKVAVRLNGMYENSGSFRKYVGLTRYGFNPTLTFTPTKTTRITLGYERFRDDRTADRGIPSFQGRPLDVPISAFFGNPDLSHVRASVNLGSINVQQQLGRVVLHNRTTFGAYDRGYQNFVPGAVSADKTQDTVTAYNNATQRFNFFNQTDVTFTAYTGAIKHILLAGAEVGRQLTDNLRNTGFFNNTATSILVPLSASAISTPVTWRQSATDADNHLVTNVAAGYVQDQVELSRYVQLIGGIRFDHFDLRYHDNRAGTNLERTDKLVSPRAGIVVKPLSALSIYGSYSISYLPSSGDQFSSLTTITQQVKPEKFNNYEVGVKWDVRPRLSLTTAVFRLDRENTRSTDPNDPTRIIQTGSTRTNGFEVGLNGNLTRLWSIAGGYAYQDAFISSATTAALAGQQVGQVPHHTFSLWNNYQFLPKLGAGLGILHRSDMFAAVDNTVTLPGYTRADAAVFYSLTERWRLQANLENLLDKKYYLNADSNTNISPGSPRALRVGLTARF
jgi:catecholate siderophore receptor